MSLDENKNIEKKDIINLIKNVEKNKLLIIEFDGCIGSGKTSIINYILKNIKNNENDIELLSIKENIDGSLFEKYCKDQDNYAFKFQTMITTSKYTDIKNSFKTIKEGKPIIVFIDRSYKGDSIFLELLLENNKLNKKEYESLTENNNNLISLTESLYLSKDKNYKQLKIFVDLDFQTSLLRKEIRSRIGEENYPIKYLEDVYKKHQILKKSYFILNNNKFENL